MFKSKVCRNVSVQCVIHSTGGHFVFLTIKGKIAAPLNLLRASDTSKVQNWRVAKLRIFLINKTLVMYKTGEWQNREIFLLITSV